MKAEHKYRALIHQSPDPIFVSRLDDFAFTDVNERACANYGYTQKEFLNMEIFDIETKAPLRQQVRDLYEAIEIGHVVEVDGVNRRKDGTIFPVHVRFTRLDDEYAMAIVRDITECSWPEPVVRKSLERNEIYLVKAAIPEIGGSPGDHITVCPSDQPMRMLHRDIDRLDLGWMLRAGLIEWLRDVSHSSSSSSPSFARGKEPDGGAAPLRLL